MIIFRSISAMSLLSVSLSFLFFSLLFFLIVKFITVDWRRLEWNFWNMPISNADKARAWLPHFACGSGLFSWRQTATAVWCCLYSNRKQKERLYTFSPLWQHFSLSHLLPHSVSSLCLWRSTTKWLNVSCASVAVHCTPHASPKHTHTFFAMYVPCWTVGRWTASQLLHITTPEKPEHCSSSGLSSLCEPHHHRHRRLSLSVFSEFVSVCVCLLQESAVQRLIPHCLTITRQQTDQPT